MKILVHAASLGEHETRMRMSAAALALRGHEVLWQGDGALAPPGARRSDREPAAAKSAVEVVIGGATAPLMTAIAGWRSRAHVMVLSIDSASTKRWPVWDRWGWNSLHAAGLVEERDAEAMRAPGAAIEAERLALWSPSEPASEPDATHPDTEVLERACERAIARHRSRAPRPAVFLDRDGTLVIERGYLADADDLELLPGVAAALRLLQTSGFALVVISNQSGVGRGLFPLSRVYEAMARLRRVLRAEGVELDAIYFCPHRPEAGCACRKPGIELLERASDDLGLALGRSFMVGDKRIDAETGHNAGAQGVLVRTGYGRDEERALGSESETRPDAIFDDLTAAAAWMRGEAEDAGLL
jgi:D-glycero-D-manno-heptose 1,7-bisphosphate phosphatase